MEVQDAVNYDFAPLAFETTGGCTTEADILIHYISKQKELMTGIPFAENCARIWEALSVTFQKANASAMKRRDTELLPEPEDEDEPHYLTVFDNLNLCISFRDY